MIEELKLAIDTYILNDPENNRGYELRMSTAGDCVVKLERDSQGGKAKSDLEGLLRMGTGEGFHAMWRDLLTKLFKDDFQFAEAEISLDLDVDGEIIKVPGHPDGSLRQLDAVVETKSVSESTFYMVKERGAPLEAHLEQGNVYAAVLKKKFVIFIYQNRNSGEYLLLSVQFSEVLFQKTLEKWRTVARNQKIHQRALAANPETEVSMTLSPRPYIDATQSPCWFCDHVAACYEGYADQVKAMGAQVVEDVAFLTLANDYIGERHNRLVSEKNEEAVKGDLALYLLDANLKEAKLPTGETIILKIGTKSNPLISFKEAKGAK
jgi:hypothetical protein